MLSPLLMLMPPTEVLHMLDMLDMLDTPTAMEGWDTELLARDLLMLSPLLMLTMATMAMLLLMDMPDLMLLMPMDTDPMDTCINSTKDSKINIPAFKQSHYS